MTQPRFERLLVFLPGWVAFMLYLPALANGFVWDDIYFLADLPYLRHPALWWQHIGEPLFVSQNYFRPLPLLTFVLESRIAGFDPAVFHLSNLLLHAVNTTLAVLLARTLTPGSAWRASIAGLAFALHPALIESVCWISDRFDLMMAAFLCSALLAEARIRHAGRRGCAVGILFLLALLCKETSLMLIALLPIWQMALLARARIAPRLWLQRLIADSAPSYAGLVLALLAYLALRRVALPSLYHADAMMQAGDAVQHLLLIGKTIGWYLVLAVWPFTTIGPAHPAATPIAVTDPLAWLGLVAILSLAIGLRQLWRRDPAASLLALGALIALAPVSNLVPLTIGDNIVHDRYLLLPLAFLALSLIVASAGGATSASSGQASTGSARTESCLIRVSRSAALLWLAGCVVSILSAIPHWQSSLALWQWSYERAPASRVARKNYLGALAVAGRDDEAVRIGRMALRDEGEDPVIRHNLGLALAHLGRLDEADAQARIALTNIGGDDAKARLDRSEAWNLIGYVRMQQKRWPEAQAALLESIRQTPELVRPHFNLALVYYELGQDAAARREMDFVRRYDNPEFAGEHERIAELKRQAVAARHSK